MVNRRRRPTSSERARANRYDVYCLPWKIYTYIYLFFFRESTRAKPATKPAGRPAGVDLSKRYTRPLCRVHLARRFFPTSDLLRGRPPYFVPAGMIYTCPSLLPPSLHPTHNSLMVVLLAFIVPRQLPEFRINRRRKGGGGLIRETTRIKSQVGNALRAAWM